MMFSMPDVVEATGKPYSTIYNYIKRNIGFSNPHKVWNKKGFKDLLEKLESYTDVDWAVYDSKDDDFKHFEKLHSASEFRHCETCFMERYKCQCGLWVHSEIDLKHDRIIYECRCGFVRFQKI